MFHSRAPPPAHRPRRVSDGFRSLRINQECHCILPCLPPKSLGAFATGSAPLRESARSFRQRCSSENPLLYNLPLRMRRPTRTRRLSIAAIVSLAAFALLAGAGVRSFWTWDSWKLGPQSAIGLEDCRILFAHGSRNLFPGPTHQTGYSGRIPGDSVLGFSYTHLRIPMPKTTAEAFVYGVPIWFPLLLLLIIPIRWLIARSTSAPAFPVITDAKLA